MIRIPAITFTTLLLITHVVTARDFTKPTSIALRTEISYVTEATLIEKKHLEAKKWQLKFNMVSEIHNTSPEVLNILVKADLAHSLAINFNYIIAYQTHQKTKVNGLVEYHLLANGPTLMKVEGANPAIFRSNQQLKKQFLIDPKLAQNDPKKLINTIMAGMKAKDPKIQEFFVRELINWVGLPDHLTDTDHQQLLALFNSTESSVGTLVALLENRTALHQAMGIEKMSSKVLSLLRVLPTQMEADSGLPAMVLQALNFSQEHAIGDWHIYSRWIRSNIPSITEKALLALHAINTDKTIDLVKDRNKETHLSDSSRRVLTRYLMNK